MTDVVPVREQQSNGTKRLLLAVGVVGLLIAGIFAALAVGGSSTTAAGAETPEDAYQQVLQALNNQDLLGAAAFVLPSERETLVEPMFEMIAELQRLEVVDPALDLSDVSGVNFDFDGVVLETTMLTEDLATVRPVSGRATTVVDPQTFPFGSLVLDRLPDGAIPDDLQATSDSIDGSGDGLIAVRQNGKWYVSFWYSVAEAARIDAGFGLPNPDDTLVARGAASPEAAVEQLIRAGIDLDLRRVLELLSPREASVLQEYAPLFVPEAEDAASDVRREMRRLGIDIDLRRIDLSSTKRGDHQIVSLTGGELVITSDVVDFSIEASDGSVTADVVVHELNVSFKLTVMGDCFEFEIVDPSGEPVDFGRQCADDVEQLLDDLAGPGALVGGLPNFDIFMTDPVVGIATVQEDGEWFVSPLGTLLDSQVATLAAIDKQELEKLVDWMIDQAQNTSLLLDG